MRYQTRTLQRSIAALATRPVTGIASAALIFIAALTLLATDGVQPARGAQYYGCDEARTTGTSHTEGAGALMVGADLEDMTDGSDLVVVGRVERLQSCYTGAYANIVTLVSIAPDDVLKASDAPQGPLTIEVPGGMLGEYRLAVGTSPEFTIGDRAVLFLAVDDTVALAAGFQSELEVADDGTVERADIHLDGLTEAVAEAVAGGLPDSEDPLAGGPEIIESSFTELGPSFQDDQIPVQININPNTGRPAHLTAQQSRLASINAYHTWQDLPDSYIAFGPMTTTSRTSTQGDCDGNHDVTWGIANASHGSGTLAVTYTCYQGSRTLDTDVEIDTDHFGPKWRVDGSGACGTGTFDLETVLLHENGHVLGLGHPSNISCQPCPVMDATYGGVSRNACADDQAGAAAVYPLAGGSVPPAPGNLAAVLGATNILTWADVTGEWGYEVWRASTSCAAAIGSDFELLDTVADGTVTYVDDDYDNGLLAGPYCYKARSFNKSGASDFSATAGSGGGTPSPTPTPTPTPPPPSPSPSPTLPPTPSQTATPSPTPPPTIAPTFTPTATLTATPTPTQEPTVQPSSTPVATATPAPTPSATPTSTTTATATPDISPPPAPTNSPAPTPLSKGDVNCDNKLTVDDSLDILRIVSQLVPHGACPENADYDGNGVITMRDALAVLIALNS